MSNAGASRQTRSNASSNSGIPFIGLPAGASGPQNEAEADLLTEARVELQRTYLYYDMFHMGVSGSWDQFGEEFLKKQYIKFPVPRIQSVPQYTAPADVRRDPYHIIPSRDVQSEIARQLNAELQAGEHPTTQALVPLGLRFLKILGAGSQGTAVLFEMDDSDGSTRKVVAKYENGTEDTGPQDTGSKGTGSEGTGAEGWDGPLVQEKIFMRMMVGARHIIQQQFIRGYDERDPRMYLMEFMRHGTIDKLLRKLSQRENKIQLKSSDLWRVFLCLFRACIAMSYPNRWTFGLDPINGDKIPLKEELVPTDDNGRFIPPGDDVLVNTDINYNNVMIGDYDTDGEVFPHIQAPIFKNDILSHQDVSSRLKASTHHSQPYVIQTRFFGDYTTYNSVGDLGIVSVFDDNERFKFVRAVYGRITGNPGTHTPEQFTEAWNAFTDWETMMQQDDTAGRYGWWTNLYQIGVIMVSLVTQNAYDRPPVATTQTLSGLLESEFDVLTYGGHILDETFDHYDRGLREAIAWIMTHSPLKRPTMPQLQDVLATGVLKIFAEEGRVSIAELLGTPS